jgi:hypothetical protein
MFEFQPDQSEQTFNTLNAQFLDFEKCHGTSGESFNRIDSRELVIMSPP